MGTSDVRVGIRADREIPQRVWRAIYFGLFPDFLNQLLEMPLRGAKPGPLSILRDVLWAT